jgi:hypothetical protein
LQDTQIKLLFLPLEVSGNHFNWLPYFLILIKRNDLSIPHMRHIPYSHCPTFNYRFFFLQQRVGLIPSAPKIKKLNSTVISIFHFWG